MNEYPLNEPEWKRPSGRSRWCVLAFLLLVAAAQVRLWAVETFPGAKTNAVLRFGFSSSVFASVNESDAKAAMKIWAQAIQNELSVRVPAEPQVLNDTESIASAMRSKLVDAVTMTAEEYWVVGSACSSSNVILGVSGGLATEEYLVLVRRESNLGRIDELKGGSLVFFQNPRASLAPVWFETLLLKSGLGQSRQFCARVSQAAKLSQAVLPVFFGQADACVVTRRGFQVMNELNPQVGQHLKVLVSSPAMVPVVFLFRADYSGPAKDHIIAILERVNSTVAGQQVMTLFQCDSVKVYPVSALDTALDLLAAHASLVEATNHAESARPGVPLANVKAGQP